MCIRDRFFYRTAGIPVSAFVSVFNITMFLLGAWVLGKQFALTTVLSTVIYPLLLGLLEGAGITGFVTEERLVRSSMPVSYTHLDVYKRQSQAFPLSYPLLCLR